MRVVYVATSYPRDPDDASGHFVRAEALADAARGHEVHVVAPLPYVGDAGVVAHAFGGTALFAWPGAATRARARPWRLAWAPPALARAAALVRTLRPDDLVAHWAVPSAWPIARAAHGRTRVVSHGADVRLLVGLPAPLRAAIVGAVVSACDEWRFVASSLQHALLGRLPADLAARVAARAVVRAPTVDVMEAGEAPPGDYVVVVGRLVRDKRVDLAIDAAEYAGVRLVVVGDGPGLDTLRGRARRRGADVRFTGLVGRRAALGWIRGARALLHPSEVDAAPTCVLEARAMSVPVLAADVGDVGAWARSDADITVLPRDAHAWASAIERAPRRR